MSDANSDAKGSNGLFRGSDNKSRCWWCAQTADYQEYHDNEWGRPVTDDHRLFEKICLEGFQAGLSWLTILRKRENFRDAFCDFDFRRVSKFEESDVERLLGNSGIVRHRKKIESTINNAHRAIELVDEFGNLANYFGQFKPSSDERPKKIIKSTIPSTSPTSKRLHR